jgi:SAM-dependent methyltransferase
MINTFSATRRRLLAALALLPAAHFLQGAELDRTGGPYVPTPQVVVDEMLRVAGVGRNDYVVDLGSGDGVIVLTAATRLKARGFGVDIDPDLVELSNIEARRLGVADRARFFVRDVFKTDISQATVVTLYLLPSMMTKLRPKIFGELRPGARVVSHDYHFGDEWKPDEQLTFDVPEKEEVHGVPSATVYLWIIPARVAGHWRLEVAAPHEVRYDLALRQNYQRIEGTVASGRPGETRVDYTQLRGEEILFAMPARDGRHLFRGRVSGDAMEGSVTLAGGATARWSARRTGA